MILNFQNQPIFVWPDRLCGTIAILGSWFQSGFLTRSPHRHPIPSSIAFCTLKEIICRNFTKKISSFLDNDCMYYLGKNLDTILKHLNLKRSKAKLQGQLPASRLTKVSFLTCSLSSLKIKLCPPRVSRLKIRYLELQHLRA